MTKESVKRMLDAVREAQRDGYVMTPEEAEALFGENAPKPRPKVEPKSLPIEDFGNLCFFNHD
jgi:hypothetical protein